MIGANIQRTISTYNERYFRHPIKFVFEDARKGSVDGLTAYRKLVEVDKVDVLIGATTSNGTLARGFKKVALRTEQTDYTTDIAKFFRERFLASGGTIILDEEFLPDTTDFRSLILRIKTCPSSA